VGDAAVAEVLVALDLEVLVGEPAIAGQLLLVRQVLAIADLEVVPHVEVDPRRAVRDDAEHAPAQQRLHRPREVVVQARDRHVG
jgi:hypothetical protein